MDAEPIEDDHFLSPQDLSQIIRRKEDGYRFF